MTQTLPVPSELSLNDQEWRDPDVMPPTDLLYDDGDKMESPWHAKGATLILASYAVLCGGRFTDSYAGANMFLYFSSEQARNRDYRGPDVFIVKNVDGTRHRLTWTIWEEGGRYPNVIFELLSKSTEREDLEDKKRLYEQVFRTPEYFCLSPEVERLLGWKLDVADGVYKPLELNEHGRLWSNQLNVWIGPWRGFYLAEEHTWLRFYTEQGDLVLLPEESEHQRAETERQRAEHAEQQAEAERQRADDMAARVAELEAELRRLRGDA